MTTRLAGASLTVLNANRADGIARGRGVRRDANLEDVFVALTGARLA